MAAMLEEAKQLVNEKGLWKEEQDAEELFQLIKQRTSFLAAVTDKTLLDQEVSRRDKVPDVKRR